MSRQIHHTTELPKKVREKILGIINLCLPEAHVILYGSRARGTHDAFSDIDLALDTKKIIDLKVMAEISSLLDALLIPYKIDLVDIQTVSEKLKNNILQEGVVWKS